MLKVFVFLCSAVTVALAADAHKIDFTTIILDADDMPMSECTDPINILPADPACKAKRQFTLGLVAQRALNTPEQGISMDESKRRGDLALAVYHASAYELIDADRELIEKRIAAVYGPLIVARSFPLLRAK